MNLEQTEGTDKQELFQTQSNQYLCQRILQRDHNCFGDCLNYSLNQKTYKLRLIQEASLNYSLSPNEEEQLCSSIIQEQDLKKRTTLRQRRKFNKQKPIPFKNQQSTTYHMKQIIRKLQQNNIPLITQAAVSGLSEKQLINIHLGLSQEKDRKLDYLFQVDQSHYIWIKQYMNQQTQNKLSSMQKIYEDFLTYFKFSQISISKKSFKQLVKSLGFTYKIASKINFRATTSINKSKQFIYALTILYHIKEEKQFIYIDETGIGKDFLKPKVWCNRNQTYYIDRADIRNRINIIGAMSKDLLVYQCLMCNINSQIVSNFLIKLILICNQQYGLKNYIFIMDNAAVHKEHSLTRNVLNYVNYLYLPPYTPQLNPIENVWGEMKNKLSKQD